jgi:hypothetical protein
LQLWRAQVEAISPQDADLNQIVMPLARRLFRIGSFFLGTMLALTERSMALRIFSCAGISLRQ